jgi:3-isopropylmalate dehydrogenase
MLLNLTILPGDGIGPEVTEQAVLVLQTVADGFGHQVELRNKPIGGAALTAANDPLPADTIQACLSSSAVLLGAVGSPAFDRNPGHLRPEAGLLRLRRELGAYANLRPALFFPALSDSTSASRGRLKASRARASPSIQCATANRRLNESRASLSISR